MPRRAATDAAIDTSHEFKQQRPLKTRRSWGTAVAPFLLLLMPYGGSFAGMRRAGRGRPVGSLATVAAACFGGNWRCDVNTLPPAGA